MTPYISRREADESDEEILVKSFCLRISMKPLPAVLSGTKADAHSLRTLEIYLSKTPLRKQMSAEVFANSERHGFLPVTVWEFIVKLRIVAGEFAGHSSS